MVIATEKAPPDGGYGWVIVFAQALSNFVIIPLMQSFGLIFKDTFTSLGLSATQGSLIINLNSAFGMMTGLANGVLLKIFGYRKIAFIGGLLMTIGIIFVSFSRTFTHFIVSYGIITAFGMGMCLSAYSLALNSYFKENRGKAIGLSMTITGFGPILMPQVINFLMQHHTIQGVTLILAGISANTLVSAALLQPIAWHMKKVSPEKDDKALVALLNENLAEESFSKSNSLWSIDQETAAIFGMDSGLSDSILSLRATSSRKTSTISVTKSQMSVSPKKSLENLELKPLWKRIFSSISQFFDLDLLKDPIYINIMLGMSLAIFAELNFSVLTAFILDDFGLTTAEIATFLSILGIADIIFRFLAPYIGKFLNKPPRPMYALTLFLLIATRFSLLLFTDFYLLLGVAAALGIAKGVRTVYMNLVIPTYVPLEKLASASGIQMMVNGLFILIGGPILGFIRDRTGSYSACIIIMNCVTFTTIVMWIMEAVIVRYRQKNKLEEKQENILLNK